MRTLTTNGAFDLDSPFFKDLPDPFTGPYFHNGSAATLHDVVDFYESRFNLGLTSQERSDLLALLRALS